MRLDPAGVPDATFGPGGVRAYDVGSTGDGATDAFATADGKIVVAGHSTAPEINGVPFKWSAIRVEGNDAAPPPASVEGRLMFYNNSGFDGNNPAADAGDDAAVATDKRALLPGQAAGFVNLSSYARGINGVMVDVKGLRGEVTAADFDLSVGTPGGAWAGAAALALVTRRPGAGTGNSDRVILTWPDGAIRNTWLRVTVKANNHTGLAAPDVFWFGNLVGETGDAATPGRVSALDLVAVRRAVFSSANITSRLDINRDGRVNALDVAAVRGNLSRAVDFAAPAAAATTGFAVARVWDKPLTDPLG